MADQSFRQPIITGQVFEYEVRRKRVTTETTHVSDVPERVAEGTHELLGDYLARYFDDGVDQERFIAASLDNDGEVLGIHHVATGTGSSVQTYTPEILRFVLLTGGTTLAVAHSHPHGDSRPSDDDIASSMDLAQSAAMIDIGFADSIVVGKQSWTSIGEVLLERKRSTLGKLDQVLLTALKAVGATDEEIAATGGDPRKMAQLGARVTSESRLGPDGALGALVAISGALPPELDGLLPKDLVDSLVEVDSALKGSKKVH